MVKARSISPFSNSFSNSGEDCWKMLILIPGYSRRNTGRMWGSHSALAA